MITTTQPTDTEMLDWMIDNGVSIKCNVSESKYWLSYEFSFSDDYKTPRQAIAAEMAKEAK